MKQFIVNVIGGFKIGPKDVQVAFTQFSNNTRPEFSFNTFSDASGINSAIEEILYKEGMAF